MKGGMMWFLGGVLLVIAVFIPMSVLQDSSRPKFLKKSKNGRLSMGKCPQFKDPPPTAVGHYVCGAQPYRKKRMSIAYACKLKCPAFMTARPSKPVIVQCYKHKGRWVVHTKDVQCVSNRPVAMVEQQSAQPKFLNQLLSNYLSHSYSYLTMAFVFDRADVQLPGFHKYFMGLWEKSHGMARNVMKYINMRGGYIDMPDLARPKEAEILDLGQTNGRVGLVAMETAMAMEKKTQQLLLDIMDRVEKAKKQDPHMVHFLETNAMTYTFKAIEELRNYITILRSFKQSEEGDYEIGEYEVDNALQ